MSKIAENILPKHLNIDNVVHVAKSALFVAKRQRLFMRNKAAREKAALAHVYICLHYTPAAKGKGR